MARQGWREGSAAERHSLGSSAHLLRQTQKLQAAGCPGAAGIFSFPYSQLLAFSPTSLVFLSKGRGLASAPWL